MSDTISTNRPTRQFDLTVTAFAGSQYAAFLRKHLPQARKLLRCPLCELSLVLVGDVRMAHLHKRYLGIDGPTDVLTFEIDVRKGQVRSGEVVICVPEARRRSRREGVPIRNELLLYAIHGMLHLAGFDDRTKSGYQRMHQIEDRILSQLGVGATFIPERKGGPCSG
jgi:rRNA maturation RNase YbeY